MYRILSRLSRIRGIVRSITTRPAVVRQVRAVGARPMATIERPAHAALQRPRLSQPGTRFFSQQAGHSQPGQRARSLREIVAPLFSSDGVSLAFLGATLYGFYQLMSEVNAPRETPVIAKAISRRDTPGMTSDFGEEHHGSLSAEVLEYHGKTFLKKGAGNREKLLREFIIGDALHELYPDSQPMTMLFHKRLEGDKAQYFTLSEIKPGSQDFADFIKSEDKPWREQLGSKPLVGFERALAMVGLMAGQQDCKFANLVIVDKGEYFEAYAIDFELSGKSFFKALNCRVATSDFSELTSMIRDLQPSGDGQFGDGNYRFELTGDPRGKAFAEYVKSNSMNKEVLDEFYQHVAEHDFESTLEKLELLKEQTDLVRPSDIAAWRKEFQRWKDTAQEYCDQHRLSQYKR